MKRYLNTLIISFFLVIFLASQVYAAVTTLTWDASPTPEVTGYKVYYKLANSTPPFDGIGAVEGASPIDVGSVLTTTLTGLLDSGNYYFTLTAYDASGFESSYSNIVSSGWMPELLVPADRAVEEPVPATFQWSTAPVELDLHYTLYYGTDPNLIAAAVPNINTSNQQYQLLIISLLSGLLLTLFLSLKTQKRGYAVATAGFTLCLALTACGGGGGGGESSTPTSVATSTSVYSVDKGTSDYHQAFDLEPGTTYYWKVVGVEVSDPSQTYSSTTFQFTTENF